MFGKKQRRIEELEQKVDGFEIILPYVPLAEEIHRRLDAFSDEVEASGNPAAYVDSLVPTMTEEGRVTYLRDIFQRMPFHEQLEVLHRYYDDDETIREILNTQRKELIERQLVSRSETSRKLMIDQLKESVLKDGLIELGVIGIGNTIELDTAYYESNQLGVARLKGRTLDEPGKLHVLEHGGFRQQYGQMSDAHIPNAFRRYAPPHHVARVGTTLTDGDTEVYEPTLFKGVAAPYIEWGKHRLDTSRFKLTRFVVNDTVIFS